MKVSCKRKKVLIHLGTKEEIEREFDFWPSCGQNKNKYFSSVKKNFKVSGSFRKNSIFYLTADSLNVSGRNTHWRM